MTDHLPASILNALADGELSADQLATANAHLAECSTCISSALHQSLLKTAAAKAGQRYTAPSDLHARLAALASQQGGQQQTAPPGFPVQDARSSSMWSSGSFGWALAALLFFASVGMLTMQRLNHRADIASAGQAALVNEVFDQHLALLAANSPPQVVSSDKHTVKPWFQGKLPFSFNLPENLPAGTTLDGADLAYLHNQPVAQLLFSIGKHRVSVFVREKSGTEARTESLTEHAGFHIQDFDTDDLELVAISDVDPSRLVQLTEAIRQAQALHQEHGN